MNENIFETILKTNAEYVESVNSGAGAEMQDNLLAQCRILFKTMILDAGLATEYREYCDMKSAKGLM